MHRVSRLKWQCRRGTLELDIMLNKYLDSAYQQADATEKKQFMMLLDLQDTELWGYLMGQRSPESGDLANIVKKIRALPTD